MDAIKVLDHGFVRLVEHMGDDLSIVRSARVSYDAAWRAGEDEGSDARLIGYLLKNQHTTPFESVRFQFEVMVPIFLTRQWFRHRTMVDPTELNGFAEHGLLYQKYWSYNELSARYKELPEVFYVPDALEVGQQSKRNKQQRDFDGVPRQDISDEIWMSCTASFKVYRRLLEMGAPREIARIVLPLATYTHSFAATDLHNLFHFLRLRVHSHAQKEIQAYARAILELITPVVPVAVQAFKTHILGESPSGNSTA